MENKYYKGSPMNEKLYEEMKRKSLEGQPVKRTRKRYRLNKKVVLRNIAVILAITIGVTLGSNHVPERMIESIHDNAVYVNVIDDYRVDVFNQAKSHVMGTTSDWMIDYQTLADYINESDDKDLEIFRTYVCFRDENLEDDENQMNQVISRTNLDIDTFDEYLKARNYENGYADIKEYVDDCHDDIIDSIKVDGDDFTILKTNPNHPKITDVLSGGKNI